jgi:hypothetical protein
MQCPQCGHENSGDAKFCPACGRRLTFTCGACATELPPGAKFCRNAGKRSTWRYPGTLPRESFVEEPQIGTFAHVGQGSRSCHRPMQRV